jgi:diaminopimelate decarboxylase
MDHPAWTVPGHLEVKQGRLHVSGVDATQLASQLETPLFLFSASRIRENVARLRDAARLYSRVRMHYASKANNLLGILRAVKNAGADIEVNSGGELFRALRVGFHPNQIIFNGAAKTRAEIAEAVEAEIFAVNLDSEYELEIVEQEAKRSGKRANVAIRLVPDVGTRSHIGLQTALYTSKFGVSPAQARGLLRRALQNPNLVRLAGVHIHVGSQTPDATPYAQAFLSMWEHMLWLHRETGHALTHINIGGGVPVNYLRDAAQANEISQYERAMLGAQLTATDALSAALDAVRTSARTAGTEHLLDDIDIVFEPGRSVIADAGVLLTSVRNIKERPETGDVWLLTDAGYNLMLSMVMYHWYYHVIHASRSDEPPVGKYKIAGPLCDGGDVYFDLHGNGKLPDYRRLPENVRPGDPLAILNVGAYTLSQMTAYNGRPFPAVALLHEDGDVEIIRKRDSYSDLIINET